MERTRAAPLFPVPDPQIQLFLKKPLFQGFFNAKKPSLMSKGMQTMTNPLYKKHVISISDLTRPDMELVVATAQRLKAEPDTRLLKDKLVASCFFEASTRTRLSFETAVQRLGGNIIGFADGGNTSAKKGETLADSIKIIGSYTDAVVIVTRKGATPRLRVLRVPVINGGDGSNQHPTQTLLDLFSIHETQRQAGRPQRRLRRRPQIRPHRALAGPGPQPVQLPLLLHLAGSAGDAGLHLRGLEEKGIQFSVHETMEEVMPELDILYMTRVQKERFDETEYKHMAAKFVLEVATLEGAKPTMKILHPLPRVDEIDVAVDKTPTPTTSSRRRTGFMHARRCWLWY